MFEELLRSIRISRSESVPENGVNEEQYHPPEHLLMEYLTAESGGPTWQSDISTKMEWSATKTSRVLSELEDEGRVIRYQIGRKKIVSLPNQLPESIGASEATPEMTE